MEIYRKRLKANKHDMELNSEDGREPYLTPHKDHKILLNFYVNEDKCSMGGAIIVLYQV